MKILVNFIILLFLYWESVQDIKNQQISLNSIIVAAFAGLIIRLFGGEEISGGLLCGILPGIFFVVISKISYQSIGYGDGFVIMILGEYLGWKEATIIVFIAMFLMMMLAMVMLLKNGFRYNVSLPFIPCILFAYVGGYLL